MHSDYLTCPHPIPRFFLCIPTTSLADTPSHPSISPPTSLADTPSHPSISPPTSLPDTPSHASFFEACFSILSLGTVGFRYYGRRTRIATFALDDDFRAVHRLATPSTLAHTKNPTDNAATATRRPSHAAVARASGLSVFKVRYDARR